MAATIVDEYSKYLIEGSGIDVIVKEITEEIKSSFEIIKSKHKMIKFGLINTDIDNPDVLNDIKPEQYDNVIILSNENGIAELKDSETISKLLEFRHYFKNLGKTDLKTQLITEVADSENIEIIQETGVKDFLISNQFVSKIYAQVSEKPDVLMIYQDLFREKGSEVYIKPISRYIDKLPVEISFGDLCAASINRNESCFGIKISSEEQDKNKGYGIYINPLKNKTFKLTAKDSLITLAEDET
jgi:ion channel POLLUX/CASTOR